MSVRKSKFSANTSMDNTALTSLANGAGWLGPKVTLVDGSNLADDEILVHVAITCGAVTVGNTFELYLIKGDPAGSNFDAGFAPGATGTGTLGLPTNATASSVRDQLQYVGAIPMSVTTSGSVYKFSFWIPNPGPTCALYAYNNTGAALSAATISYETVDDNIA
jgi:hypothetical protein